MGTSRASAGSPSKVPMVPSWVPDVVLDDAQLPTDGNQPDDKPKDDSSSAIPTSSIPLAPVGRFRAARTSLGKFASSGGSDQMRRGVGHYVRTGFGGSAIAASRFGGTSRTAGSLYDLLGGGRAGAGADQTGRLDRTLLEGRSARDVIDAIVEAARPVDGTQDAEASRNSINDALSEVMERFPEGVTAFPARSGLESHVAFHELPMRMQAFGSVLLSPRAERFGRVGRIHRS
jgi:hypothetical protein